MAFFIVFTGIAGSGKTSLVSAYSRWLRKNLIKVGIVNLDPGAEVLPYNPHFDIRRLFTLEDIMKKYGLGPNGAFIKAAEVLLERLDDVFSSEPFKGPGSYDLVLIDTPGQIEAFLLRPAGSVFLRRLSSFGHVVVAYLIDSSAVENVVDAVTLWFLYVLLQVKTGLITVPVISKADAAKRPEIVKALVENPEELLRFAEERSAGLADEILPDLFQVAKKTRGPLRSVLVSSATGAGLWEMHALIHEALCACGDLT